MQWFCKWWMRRLIHPTAIGFERIPLGGLTLAPTIFQSLNYIFHLTKTITIMGLHKVYIRPRRNDS